MKEPDPKPEMQCREDCGACCIYPSISSPIPGMPGGKPANIRCIQLTDDLKCKLFGNPQRPQVCINFRPEITFCGNNATEARDVFRWLLGEI